MTRVMVDPDFSSRETEMTDTTPPATETNGPNGSIIGNSFALLFRNYWLLALVGTSIYVAGLIVFGLNFVPVIGQLLGMFLYSLAFSLGMLVALGVARREPSVFIYLTPVLNGNRLVELAIALVPIGLLAVFKRLVSGWIALTALGVGMGGGPGASNLLLLTYVLAVSLFEAWLYVKLAFTPFFASAVPADAAIRPFQRMRQSAKLSRGRVWKFVFAYFVVAIIAALFDLIPLLGSVVIAAVLGLPLKIACLLVIYHRLIARPLEGLAVREKTAADRDAETSGPV
jgi:hypothetical protein